MNDFSLFLAYNPAKENTKEKDIRVPKEMVELWHVKGLHQQNEHVPVLSMSLFLPETTTSRK